MGNGLAIRGLIDKIENAVQGFLASLAFQKVLAQPESIWAVGFNISVIKRLVLQDADGLDPR